MAISTDEELTTLVELVRNETTKKGNTKQRIANMLQNFIDSKVNIGTDLVLEFLATQRTNNGIELFELKNTIGQYQSLRLSAGNYVIRFAGNIDLTPYVFICEPVGCIVQSEAETDPPVLLAIRMVKGEDNDFIITVKNGNISYDINILENPIPMKIRCMIAPIS